MKCVVEGSLFEGAQIIYRDLGYGSDPGVPLLKYALSFGDDELVRVFGRDFEEFVVHCKMDDKKSSESDVPELKELNYPSLSQMLAAHREVFAGLLKDFLYFPLLDALLSGNRRSAWRFAINEIVEVLDEGCGYVILGFGYKI